MALTRVETQVLWSSATSITLSAATMSWSDAITFDATDVAGGILVSADNASGSPLTGDTMEVWIAYTTGDVLGDSVDDYATEEHAMYYGILDTFATNTPGEDPARRAVPIDVVSFKGCKIGVKAAQAASRNIVARVRLQTQRAS